MICLAVPACSFFHTQGSARQKKNQELIEQHLSKDYGAPRIVAQIQNDEINESSGLAASRRNPDIFWTHNDSGDDAFIYAFDRTGKRRGTFRVSGAKNVDWEDMAAYTDAKTGESYLLIGDIGDNDREHSEGKIYRVREPEIRDEDASLNKKNARPTESAEVIRIKYPDERHDAETLLVNPQNGDVYVLSKTLVGASDIYKLTAPFNLDKINVLERIGKIEVPNLPAGLITGGDASPDGKRVVLCDYGAAYEFVLPSNAKNFDEIWKQKPAAIELGERMQGEAVCYGSDGRAVFATSEKKNPPLIEVERKSR